tara:strand:- start:348 stop:602 length:255 start_codon:yes stop_codon:yes gene_type:complete
MDDNNYLRMIANPYLLKKNKIKIVNKENEINKILYNYLSKKYPKIYFKDNMYEKIINDIDNNVREIIAKKVVDDIFSKFDLNTI